MATIIALIKIWKKKGKGLPLRAQFQFYEENSNKAEKNFGNFLFYLKSNALLRPGKKLFLSVSSC